MVRVVKRISPSRAAAGFSLLELMLALSLGLLLSGVMLQGLIDEGQNGSRLARLLRERALQRRALALVAADLALAKAVSEMPQLEQHSCSLADRLPVLHLSTSVGAITYSVGPSPSAIWRGQVLMRCGPAYGLDGQLSSGSQAQNRVVLDGLAERPESWGGCRAVLGAAAQDPLDLAGSSAKAFSACWEPSARLLAVRLQQDFGPVGGRPQQRMGRVALLAR